MKNDNTHKTQQRIKNSTNLLTTTMITLLLVDVQNDFHPGGSLAIPTADEDAKRIATFISKNSNKIKRIVSTMDSHHEMHIAHSDFWMDGTKYVEDGKVKHPSEFTIITNQDIENGKWIPREVELADGYAELDHNLVDPNVLGGGGITDEDGSFSRKKYCLEYTKRLEESKKFQLIIWPKHCIIGTSGHNMVKIVRDAMSDWVKKSASAIEVSLF